MSGEGRSPPLSNGQVAWRIQQLEKIVAELDAKVDRLTLTIAGGAVTFAISVAVFAFTILATGK